MLTYKWNRMQALLSNAFAWMRKASEDNLDGMVALLQKVLQLYAANTLSQPGAGEHPFTPCAMCSRGESVHSITTADGAKWCCT